MSQSALPPSYAEAIRELEQIKANGLTRPQLDSAHQKMGEKAASPASANELLAEIQDLAARAIAMDQSFEAIRVEFGKVDANDYTDKEGKPVEKFQPTWTGYQRRFIDMLWGSRTAATVTEAYVQEFVDVIIPLVRDSNVSLENKKQELLNFIQASKRPNPGSKASSKSGARSLGFTQLMNDVQNFTNRYIEFATGRGVEVSDQIKQLNQAISALDARITAADKIVLEMGIAIGATVVGGVAGVIAALAALGPAGPGVAISIVIAAIGAIIGEMAKMIVALVDGNQARQERLQKQAEVDRLTKELQLLEGLKSSMKRANENIQQTFSRLDDFSTIWSLVAQDAQNIGDYLAQSPDGKLDDSSLWKIQIMEGTYAMLYPGLKKYAVLVDTSNVSKA